MQWNNNILEILTVHRKYSEWNKKILEILAVHWKYLQWNNNIAEILALQWKIIRKEMAGIFFANIFAILTKCKYPDVGETFLDSIANIYQYMAEI